MGNSFQDLKVWQLATQLSKKIYELTNHFPEEERFGLTSQLKRSANSVSANIAEGHGRYHYKENLKFLYNARGSLYETESHLLLAQHLFEIDSNELEEVLELIHDLSIRINNYISYVRKKTIKK